MKPLSLESNGHKMAKMDEGNLFWREIVGAKKRELLEVEKE